MVPVQFEESVQTLGGVARRRMRAMLYAAPTHGEPPRPQTEYILVAAVETDGQAWVEIWAGIDINPAALSLPSVPLIQERSAA